MATPLQQFLIARKMDLLTREKQAIGNAVEAIRMQIAIFDTILMYLASQQTEADMGKLELTLNSQIISVSDLKPRQDNAELTEALISVADRLKKVWEEKAKDALKKKQSPEDIAQVLDNLPPEVKPHSVATKIYDLRKKLKVPANIVPATRTIDTEDEAKKAGIKWNGEPTEAVYVKWMQNPPPLDRTRRKKGD